MRNLNFRLGVLALAALGGAAVLQAQAPDPDAYDFFAKVRGAAAFKADEGQRSAFGLAGGVNMPTGSGYFGLELAYTLVPGSVVSPGIPANSYNATPANSTFTAKHTGNQLGVRVSYLQPFTPTWSWQIGLGLILAKDSLDSAGTFNYPSPNSVHPDGVWNQTTSTTGLGFQPYVGAVWNLSKAASLEFNLIATMAKRQEATPTFTSFPTDFPPQNVIPVYGQTNLTQVQLEVGYAFHF